MDKIFVEIICKINISANNRIHFETATLQINFQNSLLVECHLMFDFAAFMQEMSIDKSVCYVINKKQPLIEFCVILPKFHAIFVM